MSTDCDLLPVDLPMPCSPKDVRIHSWHFPSTLLTLFGAYAAYKLLYLSRDKTVWQMVMWEVFYGLDMIPFEDRDIHQEIVEKVDLAEGIRRLEENGYVNFIEKNGQWYFEPTPDLISVLQFSQGIPV